MFTFNDWHNFVRKNKNTRGISSVNYIDSEPIENYSDALIKCKNKMTKLDTISEEDLGLLNFCISHIRYKNFKNEKNKKTDLGWIKEFYSDIDQVKKDSKIISNIFSSMNT